MSVMRWKFYKDAFSRDCSCDIEECKTGDYILFSDHQSSLAEREQRIAELEAALRDMLEGHEDEDPNRPCIANARAALAATEEAQYPRVEKEQAFEWQCPACGAMLPSSEKHCPCRFEQQEP